MRKRRRATIPGLQLRVNFYFGGCHITGHHETWPSAEASGRENDYVRQFRRYILPNFEDTRLWTSTWQSPVAIPGESQSSAVLA